MVISNLKPLPVVRMLLVPNVCKTLTLQKNIFDKTAWAIFLSLFLTKISHKFVGKAEMVQFKVS